MKLLVTGGAGFIGSNFIRFWLKRYPEDKIINLDKLTYAGHLTSTADFADNKNYRFIKGDICNSELVGEAMEGVETVIHFAAESHVDRSILNPTLFVKTNVLGTQVLLDQALKHKVKHFHHISTDEVFGALSLETRKKFNENTPYNPHSPYSASKAAADHLVRAYFYTAGLPVTITNCANNFGPYQDPEKFLPRMITNLIDGQPILIYGDGKYVRDWLYVEDHCRAIEVVVKKGRIGETYLVGGTTGKISNLEIARKLLRIFGLPVKTGPYLKFVKDRPGHDRRYAIDWGKIKRELNWKPTHGFNDYLVKTVEWYRQNEWWWRPLKKKAESLYHQTGQK